jgi:hypothetical protein
MIDRRAETAGDQTLLERLAAAIRVPQLDPPEDELLAFESSMAASFERRRLEGARRRVRTRPWRVLVALAALLASCIGTGGAFGAGSPIPAPLRAFASALGLPITPSDVVRLHETTEAVNADLARGASADLIRTSRDVDALAAALGGLRRPTRASELEARSALASACLALSNRIVPLALPHACYVPVGTFKTLGLPTTPGATPEPSAQNEGAPETQGSPSDTTQSTDAGSADVGGGLQSSSAGSDSPPGAAGSGPSSTDPGTSSSTTIPTSGTQDDGGTIGPAVAAQDQTTSQ